MASTNQLAEEEETCLAEAELEPTCILPLQVRGCLCWRQERGARRVTPGLELVSQGPGGWPPQAPAHT